MYVYKIPFEVVLNGEGGLIINFVKCLMVSCQDLEFVGHLPIEHGLMVPEVIPLSQTTTKWCLYYIGN